MIEIDTTDWIREFDSIVFDLTTMSFNGISTGSPLVDISRLGKPDYVEKSVLHYYELGITVLTNTQTSPYFYLYARDSCHGFGLESTHSIGELGGPYKCFHADFILNGDNVGRDIHIGDSARLLQVVNAQETPASNPQKFRNYEKRIALNNESNHSIDIHYNGDGTVTHLVLT